MISEKPFPQFHEQYDIVSCAIESQGKILLLHRQDHKPQGNTWGLPGGKKDHGESLERGLHREIYEETGIALRNPKFFRTWYVRFPEYDFLYHLYHDALQQQPAVTINPREHKAFMWEQPRAALSLPLMPDAGTCIQALYNIP